MMRITASAASRGLRSRGAEGRRPRVLLVSWARVELVARMSRSWRRDVRGSLEGVIADVIVIRWGGRQGAPLKIPN